MRKYNRRRGRRKFHSAFRTCCGDTTASVDICTQDNNPLRVSIIIPVHNGGAMFLSCLEAIKAADSAPYEIIVVVDGCTDGSEDLAERYGTRVILKPTADGPAAARNIGASSASGDILFFIDADVAIHPSAIGKVMQAFLDYPNVSGVIGSYDESPSARNFLSQYKNLFHHYTHQNAREEASTFWGACGAIRREVFHRAGGFDEKYRNPSIEDIEFGYRLRRNGSKIRLLKELQVKHLKRWNALSLLKADFFHRALPWTDLIMKTGRVIDDLNLKVSSRISVICIYLLVLTFLGSLYSPWFLVPAGPLIILVLSLNWNLYRFFKDKRGIGFTLKSIPWHWLYFLYCGLAFFIGYSKHQIKRLSYGFHISTGR